MQAQYYLVEYYSKFGFKTRGETFYDANIKHIAMFLDMKKNKQCWLLGFLITHTLIINNQYIFWLIVSRFYYKQ